MSAWVSTRQAAEHLGLAPRTLIRMALTAGAAPAPMAAVGGRRPTYRWKLALLDGWLEEYGKWHTSNASAARGSSDGATRTGPSGRGAARPRRPRASSRATSSTKSPSAADGSLVTLARSLASGK